jgi:hypothetical protein
LLRYGRHHQPGNAAFGGCSGAAGTTVGAGVEACTAAGTRPVDTSGNNVQEASETYSTTAINP